MSCLPVRARALVLAVLPVLALCASRAVAAPPPGGAGGPPAVGVARVHRSAVTSSAEYLGRIQAIDRVALIPRVTAYLDKRLFDEGSEVRKGQLLYVLEQGPFQAEVLAQQGALAQAQANVANAGITFQRQKALLDTPAGQKQSFDNALAGARGGAAAVTTAQGNLQSAQIQLAYTEIRAPVDGRITATAVNPGNVVSPTSGTLATIVTQDPMYVTFPVATRDLLALQKRYGGAGGLGRAAIRLILSDGSRYDRPGTLDYVSPSVSGQTDTITLRATVPNPVRGQAGSDGLTTRQLVDGEFVSVTVADPDPVERLVIARSAVLSDQQGDYVFAVDGQNKVHRANIRLGQTVGSDAVVLSGLAENQPVVVDGVQRVHDGGAVSPAAPQPVVPDPDAAQDLGSERGGTGGGGAGTGSAGTGSAGTGSAGTGTPGPGSPGAGGAGTGGTPPRPAQPGTATPAAATQGSAAPAANATPNQR